MGGADATQQSGRVAVLTERVAHDREPTLEQRQRLGVKARALVGVAQVVERLGHLVVIPTERLFPESQRRLVLRELQRRFSR